MVPGVINIIKGDHTRHTALCVGFLMHKTPTSVRRVERAHIIAQHIDGCLFCALMIGPALHEFELRLLPLFVVPRRRRARLHSGLAAKGPPLAAGFFQTVLFLFVFVLVLHSEWAFILVTFEGPHFVSVLGHGWASCDSLGVQGPGPRPSQGSDPLGGSFRVLR